MTLVKYRSATDVDIRFEDQTVVCNKDYGAFKRGNIKYLPPDHINDIYIDKTAYVYKGINNFYCICRKCGHKDIMTIQEMKNHICSPMKGVMT